MKTSPTQRSLDHLRDAGWTVAVVEKWNPHAKIRQDLWGFGDLIAMRSGSAHLLVQTTSASNAAARVVKILNEARALKWLETGGEIHVHAWAKRGARGKAKRWGVVEKNITEQDFADAAESGQSEPLEVALRITEAG